MEENLKVRTQNLTVIKGYFKLLPEPETESVQKKICYLCGKQKYEDKCNMPQLQKKCLLEI